MEILGESLQDIGTNPSGLEEVAARLETHVSTLSKEIEEETDTQVRKEKRKKRSAWKKPLKLIREDFVPRLAKYNVQNEIFGDRNSYSKTDTDENVHADEGRPYEKRPTKAWL